MVEKKWSTELRDINVALCAPGVRMVVIRAWANKQEDGTIKADHDIRPVVALESRIDREWSKRGDSRAYGTEKEIAENGWTLCYQNVKRTALVVDWEIGLTTYDDESSNTYSLLVCCPWDYSEDEAKLKDDIEYCRGEAIEKEERRSR